MNAYEDPAATLAAFAMLIVAGAGALLVLGAIGFLVTLCVGALQ